MDGFSRVRNLEGLSERPARGSAALERWSWREIERAVGGPTIEGNDIRLHLEGGNTFHVWLMTRCSQSRKIFEKLSQIE